MIKIETDSNTATEAEKYIIGTGFYSSGEFDDSFFSIWYKNTYKYANPEEVVVVNSNCKKPEGAKGTWINLNRNPQHVRDMRDQSISFGGWSISFIASATVALANNVDFIYKEQDCLAFGNWVHEIYRQAKEENLKMLVGVKNNPQKVEQSLIYVRKDFVQRFLSELYGIDRSDINMRPEYKFLSIMERFPDSTGFLKIGTGCNRPFDVNKETFYIQRPGIPNDLPRIPDYELQLLKSKGLI